MIKVKREDIILKKTNLEYENEGILNPAVICEGDSVHLFYRAVRQGNYSSIGYCRLDGPLTVAQRWDSPLMVPEFEYETHGVEDARIVKIDDLFYLTYTGYDGINARGALATSKDLIHFKKKGIIVPPITYAEFVFLAESAGKVNVNYYHNHKFYYQEEEPGHFGEQPIDVAYTIMTLSKFYDVFMDENYRLKMETAFDWFLGNNRLHQIIYNPCTGGCYDGLKETHVNINQGAESTISYLMARLTMEKYKNA